MTTSDTAATIDGAKLVRYLDEWGATMTTAKARWAAGWAAETVRKAMADPSMLDRRT